MQNDSPNPTPNEGESRWHEEFSIDSQESIVSELSFSSDSPDSDSTVTETRMVENDAEPIVELPSTPPAEQVKVRRRFLSVAETHTPGTIGEALEKSGTVLMQRSQENRLAKQLEEMQALMGNDEVLVVLKQPSDLQMQSQPAFTQDTMRGFLQHSETMFHLVHEAQMVSGTEEAGGLEPAENEQTEHRATAIFHRDDDDGAPDEFVGCFSKNNDTVLYKRRVTEAPGVGLPRGSIDNLIAQHAQCLVEAEEVTKPSVQICQTNDESLLALLTFSDQSSAVLKTSTTAVEEVNSYEDLNRALLQTYRELLTRPDEMISMQTHQAAAASSGQREQNHTATDQTEQPRTDGLLPQHIGTATTSFGLSNESQSGMALQGSSKNWTKCRNARNAAETVTNLRLLLEEFILREIPISASALKFLSRLLGDILHSAAEEEVDEEFQRSTLIDQIKRVVNELLMPHEREDPMRIVNQVKLTMEQILAYRATSRTITDRADAWAKILETSERLVCELDHEVRDPETFIAALQFGLKAVLGTVDAEELLERNLHSSSVADKVADLSSPSVEAMENYLPLPTVPVCNCFTSWVFLFLCCSADWLKEQLINFWDFLITTPPILTGPSVSFRETVTADESVVQELRVQRDHLNETVDMLRVVLEKPAATTSSESGKTPPVNVRSFELFAQLLQQADSIDLKHSDSRHNIHLQLGTAVSGDLAKHQSEDILTVTGNVRDHEGNVAVLFEARMLELTSLPEVESAIEYVTRTERLSDELDDSRYFSTDGTVHNERDEVESVGHKEDEQEFVVSSVIEEIVSTERLKNYPEEPEENSIVNAIAGEIKHCLQDLLDPLETAVHTICDRMANIRGDRSLQPEACGTELVEGRPTQMKESLPHITDSSSPVDARLAESVQEMLSMFHDANDRLAMIDSDVTTIRNQVQRLITEQQQKETQQKSAKSTHGDGHRGRSSKRPSHSHRKVLSESEKPMRNPISTCQLLPLQQKYLFGKANQYCPVEVYSCHGVAPNVLVVHWTVDDGIIDCIVGYEIHVDGVLRSVCFSSKRRTALIASVDLQRQHQITLHATPHNRCKDAMQWAPAFFLYHL